MQFSEAIWEQNLKKVNSNIKKIECPFTGEELTAVPSLKPDVAFIHAQKADKKGNVLIEGILGVQKEAVLASKKSLVTVEEIVDTLDCHPNATVLPDWTISFISHVPCGAHPHMQGATTKGIMLVTLNGIK